MSETTRRAPVGRLRAWQAAALDRYMETSPRDFLAVATPGAGKTTFALTLATELIARGIATHWAVLRMRRACSTRNVPICCSP